MHANDKLQYIANMFILLNFSQQTFIQTFIFIKKSIIVSIHCHFIIFISFKISFKLLISKLL